MKSLIALLLVVVSLLPAHRSAAQSVADSVTSRSNEPRSSNIVVPDTVAAKPSRFEPNPKKAGLYSAIVPGLGQLYNREYWKIPLVYAAIGVAGYFFVDNMTKYQSYRKAYIGRINNPNPTDEYVTRYPQQEQLQQLQNDYSKYLDLTVLLSVIGYSLQVIDAITSAHLKNFDISRDISFKVRPVVVPGGLGMGMVVNF